MSKNESESKLKSPKHSSDFLTEVESGQEVAFNAAPSQFFIQLLESLREKFKMQLDILTYVLKSDVDGALYDLGPMGGKNITATKVTKTGASFGPKEERIINFVMEVAIEARYKSFGTDREFSIPITLVLTPDYNGERDGEWHYDIKIDNDAFRNERLTNRRIQDEITAPSRTVAKRVKRTGLNKPFRGGAPGLGKKS